MHARSTVGSALLLASFPQAPHFSLSQNWPSCRSKANKCHPRVARFYLLTAITPAQSNASMVTTFIQRAFNEDLAIDFCASRDRHAYHLELLTHFTLSLGHICCLYQLHWHQPPGIPAHQTSDTRAALSGDGDEQAAPLACPYASLTGYLGTRTRTEQRC